MNQNLYKDHPAFIAFWGSNIKTIDAEDKNNTDSQAVKQSNEKEHQTLQKK